MGKREADRQITKDDPSSSDDEYDSSTVDGRWKEADASTLSQRKIVSVKRKTPALSANANTESNNTNNEPAKPAFPTFSFGSTPQSTTTTVSIPASSTTQTTHTNTSSSTSTTTASATLSSTTLTTAPSTTSTTATSDVWNRFALKSDEWKCPTCDITNKTKDTKCLACDTPNPAAANTTDNNDATSTAPKFTFGVTANNNSSSTTAPTFSFGSSTPSFSFGTSSAFSTATTGFSFGNTAASTTGFSFGSTTNNNDTKDDKHTNGSTTTYKFGQSNDTESNGLNFASSADTGLVTESGTNAEFVGKSAEASGEENDIILCKQRTRCYKMCTVEKVDEKQPDTTTDDKSTTQTTTDKSDSTPAPTETKWLQIGEGELHVNLIPATDNKPKARFVLRTDKTQRLVLNSPILKHTPINLQNDKYIHFKSADLDGQFQLFLLKFKSRGEASAVLEAVDDAKTKVD